MAKTDPSADLSAPRVGGPESAGLAAPTSESRPAVGTTEDIPSGWRESRPPVLVQAARSEPTVVTAADFQDDSPPPWAWPARIWLWAGGASIAVAFLVGLLVGRGTAGAPAAPASAAVGSAVTRAEEPPRPAPAVSVAAPAASPAPSAGGSDAPAPSSAAKVVAAPSGVAGAFNAQAAKQNVAVAAARARHCREANMPPGSVSTILTFLPSGRVADVTVTTPTYAGTRTGSCIIAKLKSAVVPPFSGPPENVKKAFTLK